MSRATFKVINLWEDFERFPDLSPKSLSEIPDFIRTAQTQGFDKLAEYLTLWLEYLEEQMISEGTVYDESTL